MIINMSGGGSAGKIVTVHVLYKSAVNVTCTNGKKTYTGMTDTNCNVIFKLPKGIWTITAEQDGYTSSISVNISEDCTINISIFSATIRITYPAGSGSHVEGPGGYYAQSPDTSGYWEVTVPAAGDYLVCADNSTTGLGACETVSITEDGQSVDVTLSYVLSLTSDYFNAGLSISGYNNASHAVSKFSRTNEAIDLTDFSTLSATLFAGSASLYITLYISTTTDKNNAVAYAAMPGPNTEGSSRRIDISRFSGKYYIILEVVCNAKTYKTYPGGAKDIMLT